MNWLIRNFDPRGRTGRLGYWRYGIVASLIAAVIVALTIAVAQAGGPGFLAFIPWFPLLVGSIIVGIRRLHDRDRSGWWYALYVFGPLAIGGLGEPMLQFNERGPRLVGAGLMLLSAMLWLLVLIELGFLRGTSGPNRFGPAPRIR